MSRGRGGVHGLHSLSPLAAVDTTLFTSLVTSTQRPPPEPLHILRPAIAKTDDAETRRSAHEDTALPVPVEDTRQYLQITPTDDPLHPDTVETQFRRLHKLDTGSDQGRLKSVLTSDDPPTIECRLVSEGGEDAPLRYLFGLDKMAACDPAEAIWIAMSHSEAHELLEALNDPPESEPGGEDLRR